MILHFIKTQLALEREEDQAVIEGVVYRHLNELLLGT